MRHSHLLPLMPLAPTTDLPRASWRGAPLRGLYPILKWSVVGVLTIGVFRPLTGVANAAPANAASKTVMGNRNAVAATSVRIPRGGQITLPYAGVTKVLPADTEVARGRLSGGKAIIEGVTLGNTLVEVSSGNRTQLLAVKVVEPGTEGPTAVLPLPSEARIAAAPVQAAPIQAAPIQPGTLDEGNGAESATLTPARTPHSISLRVMPVEDNPLEALVSITYKNEGATSQDVTVRYAVPDGVSFVSNSATQNPTYNAGARELEWKLNGVSGDAPQVVSFRVRSFDGNPVAFTNAATVEGADGATVLSNGVTYSFTTTPLLTVFALPDRILAGRNSEVLVDVHGLEFQSAVDRIQKMGIIDGRGPGQFYPAAPTQRVEYAVMTLRGLNLHDLRDVTAIKFVLGRRSIVNLVIKNSKGQLVANLVKNANLEPGERTVLWDGRMGSGYAPPGRYTYICTAKKAGGTEVTELKSTLTIVPQTPLEPSGQPSFRDIRKSDWFSGYLAIAEKQDLIKGYPGQLFKPYKPISRVEATAVVVRALGLEDLARQTAGKDVGFLDYQDIEKWAVGYVNVASQFAKTSNGRLIVGYPSNFFLPNKKLRRDEAALIVQRMIDKETNRRVGVTGQLAPGAIITINNRTVQAADDGQFAFNIEQNTAEPITVAVSSGRP